MATITSLSFNIFSRYNGDGMRQARRDIDRTRRAIDGLHERNRVASEGFGGLAAHAAALAPALMPIAGAATAAGAAFAGLGATVGSALGLYGSLMNTGYSQTLIMWAQDQKLTKAQHEVVKSSGSMLESWKNLSTTNRILWPLVDIFHGVNGAIKQTPPLIAKMYPIIKKTTQAFQEWSAGDGLKRFVNIVIKYGVPALDAMRQGAVNTLAALGIGFRASLPLIKPVASAIERGGLALRVWAEGGGFKRFFATVAGQGPAVGEFFKALGKTLVHLSEAMARLGPATLLTVTGFLRLIAALPVPVLQALIVLFMAWRVCLIANAIATSWNVVVCGALWIAVGALYIAIGIVAVATAYWTLVTKGLNVAMRENPVILIVSLIVLLVAAIVFVATKTTWFQTAWRYTWNFIRAVTLAVWSFLVNTVFLPMGRFFTQTIPRWATTVKNWVVGAWQSISNRLSAVGSWLIAHVFGPIGRFFTQTIPRWATTVKNWVVGAWQYISNRLSQVGAWLINHVFRPIGRFFTQTIPRWASTVKNWVVGAWQSIYNRLHAAYMWMARNVFSPIGRFFTRTIPGWANTLKNAVVRSWNAAINGIKKAWNWLQGIVKKPINIAIGFINAGIIGVWNKIAGFVGMKKQGKIAKLAKGGPVNGPGTGTSDSVPAMLSRGEHVLTAREVQAAGGHGGVQALRSALMNGNARKMGKGDGRYAEGGGVIAPKPPKLKGAGGSTGRNPKNYDPNAKSVFSMAGDLVRGGLGAIANPILDKIKGWIESKVGGGKHGAPVRKIMSAAAVKPIEWIQSWIDDDDAKHAFANGFSPWKKWRGDADGRHVRYKGKMFNVRTVAMLRNAEKLFKGSMSIAQGSYSSSVGASAGTHSGGGAVDAGPAKDAVVGALRASGFAAWRRTPKEGFSPHVHGIAVGDPTASRQAKAQVASFFRGRNGLAGDGPDTYMGGAGGAGRWKGTVISVLKELKVFSGGNVSKVLRAIAKESGGNPRAVNRGDVNAKNGDPSRGLLQVIGSTFRAYAGKYKSRGQYDPYANIYAGVNYAKHRYGRGWASRMAAPGGYFAGIASAPQGPAWVGENGPELMNFKGGESVHPVTVAAGSGTGTAHYHFHNDGTIYTKSAREFDDMVVASMQNAARKGRMPKK